MAAPPLTGNWTDTQVGLDSLGNPIIPDLSNRRRAHSADINDIAHSVIALEARPISSGSTLNAKDNGLACNLSTNDTTAFNALLASAAGKRTIYIPYPGIKVTNPITLPVGTHLIGDYVPIADSAINGSQIQGTDATNPVLRMQRQATVWTTTSAPNQQQTIIDGFYLTGGSDCIDAMNGCMDSVFRNLTCYPAAGYAGFHFAEFVQGNKFDHVEVQSGQDGFFLDLSGRNSPLSTIFDKNIFIYPYFHGQTRNGMRFRLSSGYSNTFIAPRTIFSNQDGWFIEGGLIDATVIAPQTEANGINAGNAPAFTPVLCTTSAASTSVLVPASSAFAPGEVITIQGAGGSGTDYRGTVLSLGDATHINTTVAVPATATNAELAKGSYCNFRFAAQPGIGTISRNFTIIGAQLGGSANIANLPYGIDASAGVLGLNLIGGRVLDRPIYDPTSVVRTVGMDLYQLGQAASIRRSSGIALITGNRTTGTLGDLQGIVGLLLTRLEEGGAILNKTT